MKKFWNWFGQTWLGEWIACIIMTVAILTLTLKLVMEIASAASSHGGRPMSERW